MITAQQFVTAVEDAATEIREYYWGASGQDWKSDCVGLIIAALRKCGMKWPGLNGTNWTERNAMKSRGPITEPGELFPGEVLYKYREPGNPKWKLPDDYKNDPDQRDYYHIGVVTSINPLVITHCTSVEGGIKRDTSLGAWRWGGMLKYVDYKNEGGMDMDYPYYAEVWAPNEFPVRMRKEPKRDAKIIEEVPQKSIVDVMGEIGTEEDGVWGFVRHGAVTGYMMKKFLRPIQDAPEEDADLPEVDLMEEAEKALKEAMESMSNALAAVQAAKEAR